MRQYASWQAPFYSFWSKSFYVDVARNWTGEAYGYLLLLICFTCLFMSIRATVDITDGNNIANTNTTKSQRDVALGKGKRQHIETTTTTTTTTGGQWSVGFNTTKDDNGSKSANRHYAIRLSLIDLIHPSVYDFKSFVQQIPTHITIEKGIFSTDAPSPRTLRDVFGKPIITFDTRKKFMSLDENPASVFLFTQNAIFVKGPLKVDASINNFLKVHYETTTTNKIDLGGMENGSFHLSVDNSTNLEQSCGDFIRSIVLAAYIVLVPLGFIFCVVQSLIYGLIGMLIANLNKMRMPYGTLVRLSTIAMTPVLLVDTFLKALDFNLESWSLWAFVITIGYLVFAIRANATSLQSQPELVNSPVSISNNTEAVKQFIAPRKLLSVISHGSLLVGLWIVVPLIVLVASEDTVVKENAKEAINFQLNLVIWSVPIFLLCFVIVGFPLLVILIFAGLILPVIAMVRVCINTDSPYHYPFVIHFIQSTASSRTSV